MREPPGGTAAADETAGAQIMGNFGHVGHARGAHLALIQGGGGTSISDTSATRAASSAIGADPVVRVAQPSVRRMNTTAYSTLDAEGPRSSHEQGIRAVARQHPSFEAALVDMVRASGVSPSNADSVARAILGNPALKAQAERAFQRARLDAV